MCVKMLPNYTHCFLTLKTKSTVYVLCFFLNNWIYQTAYKAREEREQKQL